MLCEEVGDAGWAKKNPDSDSELGFGGLDFM